MKNLLVVFDPIDYPRHLIEYAIELAKQDHSIIQLACKSRNITLSDLAFPMPADPLVLGAQVVPVENFSEKDEELIRSNWQSIKEQCMKNKVSCVGDPAEDFLIDELVGQSASADLILLDSKASVKDASLEKLLLDSHCPVLLIPETAVLPKRAILCYDEGFSSIYAIKMYSYLFPHWRDLPTHIVAINPKGDNGEEYTRGIQSWLPQHFTNFTRHNLEGNLQKELLDFVGRDDRASLIVLGAYGGNAMSRLFHKSIANVILESSHAAVFIVHE